MEPPAEVGEAGELRLRSPLKVEPSGLWKQRAPGLFGVGTRDVVDVNDDLIGPFPQGPSPAWCRPCLDLGPVGSLSPVLQGGTSRSGVG